MKAMILAAGFGTRLRPLTETTPKPLLEIAGRPLLEWNLLLLRRHGITEVVINLHHLGDQIERRFGDGAALGLRLAYSREEVILGTGGGLKRAEPLLGDGPFVVLNGDTLVDLDLDALRRAHLARSALATLVVRADPEADRWGPVETDASQRVLRINGRGRDDAGPVTTYMFAGVHLLDRRLLRHVPAGRASSIIDAYVAALREGSLVRAFPMTGYWSDIGTMARYEAAKADAAAGVVRLADRLGS